MQISFYVLHNPQYGNTTSSSSPHGGLLDFVCKLAQTVLKKSELSLVIVDDNPERLALLDTQLWDFETTSFIPHVLIKDSSIKEKDGFINEQDRSITETTPAKTGLEDSAGTLDSIATIDSMASTDSQNASDELTAPVILTSQLPIGFDGVILNLAATPLAIPSPTSALDAQVFPERVLEIIAPDELSKQQGRDKYQHYKSLGFELIYHPIK